MDKKPQEEPKIFLRNGRTLRFTETGNYIVHDHLGNGSFANVYLAENEKTKELVAIKCVSTKISDIAFKLFLTECKILSEIKHENIVRYIDYKGDDDACYLIMEYCEDGSLSDYIFK